MKCFELKDRCFIHSKSQMEYYVFYIKPVTSVCSRSQIKLLHHNAFISGPRQSKGCSYDFHAVFQTSSDTEVESDKLPWLYITAQLSEMFYISIHQSENWQQANEILPNLNLFLNLRFSHSSTSWILTQSKHLFCLLRACHFVKAIYINTWHKGKATA